MGGAGDVEHQPVTLVEPDKRRIAVAGIGKEAKHPPVGFRVVLQDGDTRHTGARIGERQARGKSQLPRLPVGGGKADAALDLLGGGERPFIPFA
jgi:hypothetical protein